MYVSFLILMKLHGLPPGNMHIYTASHETFVISKRDAADLF